MNVYCRSGTVHRAPTSASPALQWVTSWLPSWKYDVISKIRLCQSPCIYLKNNPARFHPDRIWKAWAFCSFWRGRPNKNNSKMSSVIRSVPDPKKIKYYFASPCPARKQKKQLCLHIWNLQPQFWLLLATFCYTTLSNITIQMPNI